MDATKHSFTQIVSNALVGEIRRNATASELALGRRLRVLCYVLLIAAAASLLLVKNSFGPLSSIDETTRIKVFCVGAFITLIHLGYLYLVLSLLVFHVPVQSFRWQALIIPALLIIAYICGVYEILGVFRSRIPWISPFAPYLKYASSISFIAVYYFWFLRDLAESRHLTGGAKRARQFWMAIDALVTVVLIGYLFASAGGHSPETTKDFYPPFKIGLKDIIVLSCAALFYAVQYIVFWVLRSTYKDKYKNYLDAQLIEPLPKDGKDILTDRIQQWTAANPNFAWVDFGSGDSRRLMWLITEGQLGGTSQARPVLRYDIRPEWEHCVCDPLRTGSQFTPSFYADFADLISASQDKPCIVHISHVLYDYTAVHDIRMLISKRNAPTLFIIRGYGVSVFRTVSVFQSLIGAKSSNISHLWERIFLEELRPYFSGGSGTTSLVIKQEMDRNLGGLTTLQDFFEVLYESAWTEQSRAFLSELWNGDPSKRVQNDDVIYLFEKAHS